MPQDSMWREILNFFKTKQGLSPQRPVVKRERLSKGRSIERVKTKWCHVGGYFSMETRRDKMFRAARGAQSEHWHRHRGATCWLWERRRAVLGASQRDDACMHGNMAWCKLKYKTPLTTLIWCLIWCSQSCMRRFGVLSGVRCVNACNWGVYKNGDMLEACMRF